MTGGGEGSRSDVERLCFRQHAAPEVRTQTLRGVQIDPSAKQQGKFLLHVEERETRGMAGLEFDQDIDIALGTEILTGHRAKEGQSPDVVLLVERSDSAIIDSDPDRGHQ